MADPIIKIKIDYRDLSTGIKTIEGELRHLDTASENTVERFRSLSDTFNIVGKTMRDFKAGSGKFVQGTKNINKELNKTESLASRADKRFEDLASSLSKVSNKTQLFTTRTRKAKTEMRGLNNAILDLTKNLKEQVKDLNSAAAKINKNISSFDKLESAIKENTGALDKNAKAHKKLKSNMKATANAGVSLGGVLASIVTLQSINIVIQYADAWAKLTNHIRIFTETEEETIAVRERLFNIAQKTRTELTAQTTLYNRLKIAQKDLNISEAGILKMTEAVGYALGVTSTSALEARGSLIQLGQAFGSGIVRAEEFNSINEGTPKIMKAVADALRISRSELRMLVLDGKITSEIFSNALLSMADSLEEEYGKVNKTIGQAFTNIRNSLKKFVGELGKSTGAYQDFVNVLETSNSILQNNMDIFISLTEYLGEFTLSIVGPLGALFALGLLQKAFIGFIVLVGKHPLVATFIAAYTATNIATKFIKENIIEAGKLTAVTKKHLEEVNILREKAFKMKPGEERKNIFKQTENDAKELFNYLRSKKEDLKFELGYWKIETTMLIDPDEIDRSKKTVSELREQIERVNHAIGREVNQNAVILKQQDAVVKGAQEETAEAAKQVAIWKEESKLRSDQLKFIKENKKSIQDVRTLHSKIINAKKLLLRIDSISGNLAKSLVEDRRDLLDIISQESGMLVEAKRLSEGAGKEIIKQVQAQSDLSVRTKEHLDMINKKLSLEKKFLKMQVSEGTQARKMTEALERSGKSETAAGKALITRLQTFVDAGAEATTTLFNKFKEISAEAYNPFDVLTKDIKDFNKAIDESNTALIKLLKTAVTSGVTARKNLKALQEAMKAGDIKIDSSVILMMKRLNKEMRFGQDAASGLSSEFGITTESSKKLAGDLDETAKKFLKMKLVEQDLAIQIEDNAKTTYKATVDSLQKQANVYKIVYGDISKTIVESWLKMKTDALDPMEQHLKSIEDPIIATKKVFVDAMKDMEDSLVNFVMTGKLEWKSLVSDIIEGLVRVEIQQAIIKPLGGMFKEKGIFETIAGVLSAQGNVFGNSGVQAFGSGGSFTNSIVSKPTMFAHGSGFGVMGEKGDEAILPLTRTSSGNLGVEAKTTPSTVILNVENNTGQEVSAEQVSSQQVGNDLILSIVLNAANNNGGFSRGLNGALSKW